jgi:hypothetical protein
MSQKRRNEFEKHTIQDKVLGRINPSGPFHFPKVYVE